MLLKVLIRLGCFGICFGSLSLLAAPQKPLRITMIQEWSQFNPITYNLASVEALLPFLIRGLTARTADGGVIPDLAESIPSLKNKTAVKIIENGNSKVQASWRISPKAKWGDGKPVICADFKLAWMIGSHKNVSTQSRANYLKIQNVEWDEKWPQNCKVTYSGQDWSFDRDLPYPIPSHLEALVFEGHKNESEGYDRNSTYVKDPTLAGLYSGPYLVKEFKLGSHVVLEPNPHYGGKTPEIQKIIITHLSDTSAIRAQLLSNQTDVVSAVGFPLDTAIALADESEKEAVPFKVRFQSSSIFQGLFMQADQGPLKEVLVRKAIAFAIDKETLVKAFFYGKIDAANSFLPQLHSAFVKKPVEFSRDQARASLEQAGWVIGRNGNREKEGKPLSLEFKTSAGIKVYENIQLQICDQLKQVGVVCKIKNEPPRVLLGESVPKGQFDLALFGQPITPETSLTSSFSSVEIPSEKNSWAGGNVMRWRNLKLDSLLKAFDQEWSPNKRNAIIKKMEDLYIQDRPFVPLYHRKEAMVIPKALQGVSDDFGGTGFAFPEKWTWRP